MRATVETYIHSLILQYDKKLKFEMPHFLPDWSFWVENASLTANYTVSPARFVWVMHFYRRCMGCETKTIKLAVMDNRWWCCSKCYDQIYGIKIVSLIFSPPCFSSYQTLFTVKEWRSAVLRSETGPLRDSTARFPQLTPTPSTHWPSEWRDTLL
jgi:hypothetical protein